MSINDLFKRRMFCAKVQKDYAAVWKQGISFHLDFKSFQHKKNPEVFNIRRIQRTKPEPIIAENGEGKVRD